jgi:hypothetical protein
MSGLIIYDKHISVDNYNPNIAPIGKEVFDLENSYVLFGDDHEALWQLEILGINASSSEGKVLLADVLQARKGRYSYWPNAHKTGDLKIN